MNIKIRNTTTKDINDIIQIQKAAFGENSIEKLTDDLLKDETAKPIISLLAIDKYKPIGHILFTNCAIEGIVICPLMHILAPLAVIPEYQNKGIGGILIKEGIQVLKEINSQLVFVLGHIEYYPKYGFINDAKKLGHPTPYPIPDEVADAWMVQSLSNNKQFNYKGKVICARSMDAPEHWRE